MKQTVLTVTQSELLEKLIVKYGQIVTSQQIYEQVEGKNNKRQAKKLITKLVQNGWLIRIKRGLYTISDFSGRGFLSLSPYLIANLLAQDSYVSFESALSFYGMSDQLMNKVVSVSKNRHKIVQLSSIEYDFINTKEQFFFGWEKVKIDSKMVQIASAEKALIDIVHFQKSKYSIDLVIEKLQKYQNDLDMEKLYKYVNRMSTTTIKVFGFILDLINIDSNQIFSLTKSKQGTHWMLAKDKKFNSKWRLYYDEYFDKYKSVN